MSKAGMFAGEVTESAPADGSITTKGKGYHWMQYAPSSKAPNEIADLVHWFDGSAASGLFTDNSFAVPVTITGDLINTARNWASPTVNGYFQGGSDYFLHYEAGVQNGLSAAESNYAFSHPDHVISCTVSGKTPNTTLTQQDGITVIYVAKVNTASTLNTIFFSTLDTGFPTGTAASFSVFLDNTANKYGAGLIDSSGTEVYASMPSSPGTSWVVGSAIKSGANISCRLNGVAGTTQAGAGDGAYTIGRDWLWARYLGTWQYSGIYGGELVVYNRELSVAEIGQVETWLANKWGITI